MKLITNFCILFLQFPTVTSPLAGQGPAMDGEEWDTEQFWQAATVEAVADYLEAGADINSRNKDGFTPLHLAAQSNPNPAVITALSKAGADINSRDNGRDIPLRGSVSNENSATPQFIADPDIDLSDKGPGHPTASGGPIQP